jgi:hypothetical protein
LRARRRRRPSVWPQASARGRFANGLIDIGARDWPVCAIATGGHIVCTGRRRKQLSESQSAASRPPNRHTDRRRFVPLTSDRQPHPQALGSEQNRLPETGRPGPPLRAGQAWRDDPHRHKRCWPVPRSPTSPRAPSPEPPYCPETSALTMPGIEPLDGAVKLSALSSLSITCNFWLTYRPT